MPVLVTGAEAGVGRAVVPRLLRGGGEVRVYLDGQITPDGVIAAYRGWGAKVARGVVRDEGRLELALEQVHTVVHTGGGPIEGPATVLDDVASVVSAALGAGCRRVIWPSHLGAEDPRDDPYLCACAEAEALLADCPLETVVVRRALTYGPHDPLTALLAGGVEGAERRARHAPLYLDDLAAVVEAADADRGGGGPRHMVVQIAGPEVMELGRFVDRLGTAGRHEASLAVPPHLPGLLSRSQVPDPATLGRSGTPPAEGVARTRSAGEGHSR